MAREIEQAAPCDGATINLDTGALINPAIGSQRRVMVLLSKKPELWVFPSSRLVRYSEQR